ncbi:MAG: DUF4197 domain-containing protein [Chromatiales bacterium]|nr:DUF4197 domain-containing protein [Chromatiales bacterium]
MVGKSATHWPALLALLLLPACSAPSPQPVDPASAEAAVRELLTQAADGAANRLGRPNGYYADPLVRIPPPQPVARLSEGLRRYGFERYADELVLSMNRAAEAAMPAVKPVLLAAVRDLRVSDAVAILGGSNDSATRYFRGHSEAELAVRIKPLVAESTARVGAMASYKRLLRKAAALDRSLDLTRLDVDAYITREALSGLYARHGRRGASTAGESGRLRCRVVAADVSLTHRGKPPALPRGLTKV